MSNQDRWMLNEMMGENPIIIRFDVIEVVGSIHRVDVRTVHYPDDSKERVIQGRPQNNRRAARNRATEFCRYLIGKGFSPLGLFIGNDHYDQR